MNEVELREVGFSDSEIIFSWQQVPDIRRFFKNPKVPSLKEHQAWFRKRLSSSIPFYIILFKGSECGFVRLEKEDDSQRFEISILIHPDFSKKSIGSKALQLVVEKNDDKTFVAAVLPENIASVKCFERAGFSQLGELFFYPPQ